MTPHPIDVGRGGDSPTVAVSDNLAPDLVDQVTALARAAGIADGTGPLSEHVLLRLNQPADDRFAHLSIHLDGVLAGYANLDRGAHNGSAPSGDAATLTAELCVHPLLRRRGLGRAILQAVLNLTHTTRPGAQLNAWAHGDHPSANALALALGFEPTRVLWRMRRSLTDEIPMPLMPTGVTVRALRPEADDQAWLDLNARAFAAHPEQGTWTSKDLALRMAEPWFDPAGFLVAETDDGTLTGFHWTKVHDCPHHPPIGEVYVLGVDPVAHARGLGTALTLAGLRHLRERGLDQVMLYVEESNERAIGLYRRLGFARWSFDTQFTRIDRG